MGRFTEESFSTYLWGLKKSVEYSFGRAAGHLSLSMAAAAARNDYELPSIFPPIQYLLLQYYQIKYDWAPGVLLYLPGNARTLKRRFIFTRPLL